MRTLLLADDSLTIQRVIELTFADEDIQVVAVSDGDEAIARLDTAPPDIVLVDIGMPGKSGYEVAEHVKTSPVLAHVPVILLTGAFEPIDQERANRAGCDGVLAKPFEPQFVINMVKDLLARPRAVPVAKSAADPAPAVTPVATSGVTLGETETVPAPSADPDRQLEDYFDRLDAAFADLAASQPLEIQPLAIDALDNAAPSLDEWDIAPPQSALPQPALSQSMPSPSVSSQSALSLSAQAVAPEESSPVSTPVHIQESAVSAPEPRGAVAVSSLSDAFAILLAAEDPHQAARPSAPTWSSPAAPPIDVGALTDTVARRVLEQLSDRVVRETVADIVSNVAERLVLEEIDRIKASLK